MNYDHVLLKNKKKTVFYCGGRDLGVRVLEFLCECDKVDIIGVLPLSEKSDPDSYLKMRRVIRKYDLPIHPLEEMIMMNVDVGLSVNYDRIISPEIFETCNIGFFNVHHSYNLRLRGRNITTHAILNARKENIFYHGSTIHKMAKELDAGEIVVSKACDIDYTDTAYSLFKKCDDLAYDMLREWLPRIVEQKIFTYVPPKKGIHIYKYKDLPSKELSLLDLSNEEMWDIVRAFDFENKEPAFYYDNNVKKHLVIKHRNEYVNEKYIKGHYYFTD